MERDALEEVRNVPGGAQAIVEAAAGGEAGGMQAVLVSCSSHLNY